MHDIQTLKREQATSRVMKALARILARNSLPVKLENETSPVIVVLEDDPITEITKRLSRVGGRANLIVAYPQYFKLAAIQAIESGHIVDQTVDVHHLANAGMLIDWLKNSPLQSATFKLLATVENSTDAQPSQVLEYDYVH